MHHRFELIVAHLAAILFWIAAPAFADQARVERTRNLLFEALITAQTENEGRIAENEIWTFWLDQAPSPQVRALIDKGMKLRESYAFAEAEVEFDQAVTIAPDYAEGWNQRAFIRFLRENDDEALSDLERAVALEPRHFGAWSGMFHVLFRMGRPKPAYAALKTAVEIHPWLKERGMLLPDPDAERPPIRGKEQDL